MFEYIQKIIKNQWKLLELFNLHRETHIRKNTKQIQVTFDPNYPKGQTYRSKVKFQNAPIALKIGMEVI